MQRRTLLKNGLLGLGAMSLPSLSWGLPGREDAEWLFSAADDAEGRHYIQAFAPGRKQAYRIAVSERCHGGCLRPDSAQAVLFARRPGRSLHVIDGDARAEIRRIDAGDGFHFYGHGVFDADGHHLYVTANRIDDAAGLVRVYDARADYRHLADMPLDGIGPHELRLMPDGQTLAVALGGIRTHPDYGRAKLNLDDMEPALLLMDRRDGEILARHRPSHHQLSCRHLDVGTDGTVVAGYQYQGPEWERRPLIARLSADGDFSEIALPDDLTAELRQYTASIALSRRSPLALVTAPRGHRVLVLDSRHGELLASHDLSDAAGARCDGQGGFLVSSGRGGLYRLGGDGSAPQQIHDLPIRWDNHLT
ncbi:DUF1513 domain-containing protein [Halomonas halmophila]|uniref:DUF1513 domain-containing protein n=1 Tax=Halomonas halmophila TaxID=252 RepID=A0A4Y4EXR9_9GAMM|nr:DUF1513 domain-containing protein [Halomonas halmophila]GED22742.1 hypothetical protein HHA01_17190 [Halomonas halmophila]